MHRKLKLAWLVFPLVASGCAGLSEMKSAKFKTSAEENMALVKFVRPKVFLGDGANIEIWDGEKLIGTLAAGTMIQYETTPGEHVFMAYLQGSWAVAKGTLNPEKTYYLKPNIAVNFITLGVAKAADPRIKEWNHYLSPRTIDLKKSKPVPQKEIEKARRILKEAQNGTAKYEEILEVNEI